MTDTLEKVFSDFVSLAGAQLEKKNASRLKARMVYLNETIELRSKVDELEKAGEFDRLLNMTSSVFAIDGYHGKNKSMWAHAIKNFFRRSDFYLDIFEGKSVKTDSLVVKYREAFQRREIRRTYLVPLDGVRFGEQHMDCGSFQIQRFTSDELVAIFTNRGRRAFYEWTAVDADRLQEYWFLSVTKEVPARKLGFFDVDWSSFDRVEVKYTDYPMPVQDALQLLATHHWRAEWWKKSDPVEEKGWLGFKVPIVVHIDDDLLAYPSPAPDLSLFEPWTPVSGMVIDPETGDQVSEEIGEEPVFWIDLDERDTKVFKTMMQRLDPIANTVRAKKVDWPFMEVALGFLVKAFFSKGLEQLLWNITVLEALLGEKGQGVEGRLARRIASILGKKVEERKAIVKQFKELYEIRSDLVHGKPLKEVDQRHLLVARQLARQVVIWFFHYLHYIQTTVEARVPAVQLPTRDGLLTLLNLEDDRAALGAVLSSMPEEFPNVPEWGEQT